MNENGTRPPQRAHRSDGATPVPGGVARRLRRIGSGRALKLLALGVATTAMSVFAGTATAALPVFPDNIVVFPDRDFVTLEGFQDHVGETALVEVNRPGIGVIGSARGVVQEGDVAFEINHPGGYCWGAGTDLAVTPDIRPGDVVSIDFANTQPTEVETQDSFVTDINYVDGATTFTVVGHVGPGVDPDNMEQRIVNPDLTDTVVGRRDIRAVPGGPAPDRNNVYVSNLAIAGSTFTATYDFSSAGADAADLARTAATGGGARLLSWQATDAAANRQGITIAEFGELGGPGMGGCPNGPLTSGPRGPEDVTAVTIDSGTEHSIKVNWKPAIAIPGTPAITGYRVSAVAQAEFGGEQVEIGRRVNSQSASTTTITGLGSGPYDVYVTSVSSSGETFPAIHAQPSADTTAPTLTPSKAGGTFATTQNVTLSANEPHAQIFFTTDGSDPVDGGGNLSLTATPYTGPIAISTTTVLKAVAFDPAGNASQVLDETYIINANSVVPGTPTIEGSSAGIHSVSVDWSLDPAFVVTEYRVAVTNAGGTPAAGVSPNPVVVPATQHSLTVTGLTEGTAYFLTVTAHNTNGDSEASETVGPLVPLGAVQANAGPDQIVTRGVNPTTVHLDGSASLPASGATYSWTQVTPGVNAVTITGANTLSPTFVLPLFQWPMTNDPLTFRLTVTSGASTRTDDVVITPVAGDVLGVTRAQWKAGDFRVDGTGTVDNAVVTVRRKSDNAVLGSSTVIAGVWNLRLRNGQAPAARPTPIMIESTVGARLDSVAVN